MFAYPIELTPDDNDTWLVTSPDFLELTTFSARRIDAAVRHARDALVAVIATMMERGDPVPPPSPSRGRLVVRLPLLVGLKLTLYRAMRDRGITQVALARRLECDPRQVRRLLDPTHESRLDLLERAIDAVGIQVDARCTASGELLAGVPRNAALRRAHRDGAEIRSLLRLKRRDTKLGRALWRA